MMRARIARGVIAVTLSFTALACGPARDEGAGADSASVHAGPPVTPGAGTTTCAYTGEPIFEVTRDPNLPEEDQMHFNPKAFTMPLKAAISGQGDEAVDLAKTHLWR